jgi:hypothetical protein
MNILISVGCNHYDNLSSLNGAERDGDAIFEKLTGPSAMYDSTRSRILRSPKILELRECFKQVFSQTPQVGVFTFFFAGHSGVKGSSYYLFLRDSDSESASTTAFPIGDLFGIINERVPRQVNIVIDACQSGGSSFDLHHLIKPDLVGSADSTRVTFLAACTALELASETENGGNLTTEILKCLDGEYQIQTKRAFLDLVEVASHTSRIVTQNNPKQRPITWALNLHGYGDFAKNPCFGSINGTVELNPQTNADNSFTNNEFSINSADLFAQIQVINDGFNASNFTQFLKATFPQLLNAPDETMPFLQTVTNVLAKNADSSIDPLISSQCLAASATILSPLTHHDSVRENILTVLEEILHNNTNFWSKLELDLDAGREPLCSNYHPHAELFHLPLRITKILGWLGWEIIAETLVPSLRKQDNQQRFRVASKLAAIYSAALAAVSDEQAPFLYLFSKACMMNHQEELLCPIVSAIYGSLSERKGNIINSNADAKRIFSYLQSLNSNIPTDALWRPANPMSLLTVLLLSGNDLGLSSSWSLRDLDRTSAGFYIPSDYVHFSEPVMQDGTNFIRRVGYDFWTATQFSQLCRPILDREINKQAGPQNRVVLTLIALASIVFPNRLPLCLERHNTVLA